MEKKPTLFQRYPLLKDMVGLAMFVGAIILGTFILNHFVFRSYNVVGSSMETTLHSGDRILVNRLPVTWAHLKGDYYVPNRGDIIVFHNPLYKSGDNDQYIIKRVIAFAGERVQVKDGTITVFNDQSGDEGFNPDDDFNGEPKEHTSGEIDVIVPANEVFVVGDNREGTNSWDSRYGLGTIPLYDIAGPAGVRIWPLDGIRLF